jgi:hypothetical protein
LERKAPASIRSDRGEVMMSDVNPRIQAYRLARTERFLTRWPSVRFKVFAMQPACVFFLERGDSAHKKAPALSFGDQAAGASRHCNTGDVFSSPVRKLRRFCSDEEVAEHIYLRPSVTGPTYAREPGRWVSQAAQRWGFCTGSIAEHHQDRRQNADRYDHQCNKQNVSWPHRSRPRHVG